MNSDRRLPLLSIFNFQFAICAAISAFASHFALQHATPIDHALPFIALLIAVVAWAFEDVATLIAVPLLMLAEITIADETMRLVAFGVIVAAALLLHTSNLDLRTSSVLTIAAIVILRWIPRPDHLFRETLLLLIALATTWILGNTPFAVAVAVLAALFTPAVPLRTLALPLLMLIVAALARFFGVPRVRLALPSAIALAFALVFFARSGIVARAFPYFLKPPRVAGERYTVNAALAASQSETFAVPDNAGALILSGANVAKLRRGAPLGVIEPGHIAVRVGDAADWGYLRRDQFFGTHNPLPRDPAGRLREYGYATWIDGAGRVALPRGARRIRITADASLPPGASLQVEGFEIVRR